MKKIFVFVAGLLLVGNLMANVTIDLSTGQSTVEEDVTSVVSYKEGVSSASITTPTAYKGGGVEFPLEEAIAASDIESVVGNIKCDATEDYMELTIFVRDKNGNRWYSGVYLSPYQLGDWTSFNEVPSKTYWDGQDESTYASQSIASVGVFLSPGVTVSDYSVYVKDLVINTKGGTSWLKDHRMAAPASKMMRNGRFMIRRGNEMFSAMGQLMK